MIVRCRVFARGSFAFLQLLLGGEFSCRVIVVGDGAHLERTPHVTRDVLHRELARRVRLRVADILATIPL